MSTRIANRYEILEKLGQGGMGVVYKVRDRLTGDTVALKQVLVKSADLQFASKPGTDDEEGLRLALAQEFQTLASLRHPYIVSVLDYGFDENMQSYFIMDYIAQPQPLVAYAADLPRAVQVALLVQMLEALLYLHKRGVLHRDLKPDNVLVTVDGEVKVMDFGLAIAAESRSGTGQANRAVGTLRYIAPELFKGYKASIASDLYALGIMAYELLCGHFPYASATVDILLMQILMEQPSFAGIDGELKLWLVRLLDKDPANRPQTDYEALQELCAAYDIQIPPQSETIRESYLQAAPFVGRESELQALQAALDEVQEGAGQFMLIGAASGMGKTRLVQELRSRALVAGFVVVRGQGVTVRGLPYQLWRDALRRLLLMVRLDDFLLGVLKDIVPDIDTLLAREIALAPALDGRAYQERLVLAIVDVFKQAQQPILLILDDLQWTHESLLPLRQMLKVAQQLPQLLVVGTYRDDERPDLPGELEGMVHLSLTRLDPETITKLCQFMFAERVLASDIIAQVEEESEGNTFVMVEMMRVIAQQTSHVQQVELNKLPHNILTQGMKYLFEQRLAQMPADYLPLLQTAAVSGHQIDERLLKQIYPTADLTNWYYLAESLVILDMQENRWQFIHDKLRETVLADLDPETRRNLHRRVAEGLEALYPEDSNYHEVLLAHWQEADDLDKIYHYLLPVTTNMIEIKGAYPLADAWLEQVLDRLSPDDPRCVILWNRLAQSARIQSNYSASLHYAQQALQLAAHHLDQVGIAASLNSLGNLAINQGDYAGASDLFQQSMVIRQQLGDRRGIALSLNAMGGLAREQGDYARASVLYQQGMAIRQQLDDRPGIASSLQSLGLVASDEGDYAGAGDLYQQSLAIYQQLGNLRGIAYSLLTLGLVAVEQGDYPRASDLNQQSLAICQQLGDRRGIALSFIALGWVALHQGAAQATNWYWQALNIAQDIKATGLILTIVLGFAAMLEQKGQAQRAARLLGLAQHHPATDRNARRYFPEVLSQLEATLSPDELQTALEEGQQLDLETVVTELLTEFGTVD